MKNESNSKKMFMKSRKLYSLRYIIFIFIKVWVYIIKHQDFTVRIKTEVWYDGIIICIAIIDNMYCYLQLYDHIDNKSLKIWKGKGKKNFLHLGKGIFKKRGRQNFLKRMGGKMWGPRLKIF